MFSVPGHIVQANIHIINLSAAEDKYYLEESKTLKKKKRQEKKKQYQINKVHYHLSHSDGVMTICIKELQGV